MSKHTPGLWSVRTVDGAERYRVVDDSDMPDQETIAVIEFHDDAVGETRANALLIAAAPELLDALTRIVEWNERALESGNRASVGITGAQLFLARAAIAKATGGAQ